jgi:hypothetical protein
VKDQRQATTFHLTLNRFAGYLLPPGTGLLIAHDEVLVVDARQAKGQFAIVNLRFPHQTGVTERSVSGDNGRASDHAIDDVMISQLANRKGDGFPVDFNRQDFVALFNETGVARC